jgi:low molecular weight protein-tyrosine phosphatase
MALEQFHILTVCTGNICRSPMAEGMLQHFMPDQFREIVRVSSAGTDALHGNQATVFAIQAMEQYGIDIFDHRAKRLNRSLVAGADLILAMEQYHLKIIRGMHLFGAGKAHLMGRFDSVDKPYDVPDPMGGELDLYLESAVLIKNCLGGIYSYLGERIDA